MNRKLEEQRELLRILAIPGVELVASFDPEDFAPPPAPPLLSPDGEKQGGGDERMPRRELLFSRDWICFGLHDDPVAAAQVFERRVGRRPEFVYQDMAGGLLWVGPV